jgi:hypothetical protein
MEGFCQSPVNSKSTAPVPVLLTICNQRGILVEPVDTASNIPSLSWYCLSLEKGFPSCQGQTSLFALFAGPLDFPPLISVFQAPCPPSSRPILPKTSSGRSVQDLQQGPSLVRLYHHIDNFIAFSTRSLAFPWIFSRVSV